MLSVFFIYKNTTSNNVLFKLLSYHQTVIIKKIKKPYNSPNLYMKYINMALSTQQNIPIY